MSFGALILAAGEGKRMHSERPKVLHEVCGRPMLRFVLEAAKGAGASPITIVVGPDGGPIREAFADEEVCWVTQTERLGTGHAVQVAAGALKEGPGQVMVLCGDMPLIAGETLAGLVKAFDREEAAAIVLTAEVEDPEGYGRIVRNEEGGLERIVEELDATPEERMIAEINSGIYLFDREALLGGLERLGKDNAQGEYYLTDLPELLLGDGKAVAVGMIEEEGQLLGINRLADLAEANAIMRWIILNRLSETGVIISDFDNTYIDYDVAIGAGTRILPFTVIRAGVKIGRHCEVGPFTHLRGGTVLRDGAEVGNFTEVKASEIGEKTKAKHLSYLGDVKIGAGANIGAGTIIANYDGKKKHKTRIADGAFIGSGTVLVAPVTVGKNAVTGAGAVVPHDHDVADGDLVVGVPARPLKKNKNGDAGV